MEYWVEKKIRILCKKSYNKNDWHIIAGYYYNASIYSHGVDSIYVSGCRFSINGFEHMHEDYSLYFYTDQEIRRLKLERLSNENR